jgi:dihydropteroate synthase
LLKLRNHNFNWGEKTYLMGILNITPDSFSDGGKFNNANAALKQAQAMISAGVDIIDIGGQSTRPGAVTISIEEELSRVIPIVELLRSCWDIPISVDTIRSAVAQVALEAGADLINDISAGTYDLKMFSLLASYQTPVILMHIRGNPQNMQQLTHYGDLISEINSFMLRQVDKAIDNGIAKEKLILDPGIGFAKNYAQNIQIIRELKSFTNLGYPLLIGLSRKAFIGQILEVQDPQQRDWGTAAACSCAIANGADILRVHNVSAIRDVIKVSDVIYRKNSTDILP